MPAHVTLDLPRGSRVRRRGLLGDFVAIQISGGAGKSPGTRKTLRSMGLRQRGDRSYGLSSDDPFMGQVTKVRDDCQYVPLTASAERELSRRRLPHLLDTSGVSMKTVNEKSQSWTSRTLRFSNGEYVRADAGPEHSQVTWSSALPLVTLLTKVLPVLSEGVEPDAGYLVTEAGDSLDGDVGTMLDAALNGNVRPVLVQIENAAVAFVWSARVGRSDHGKIDVHECCLSFTSVHKHVLHDVVRRCATTAVGSTNLDELDDLLSARFAS